MNPSSALQVIPRRPDFHCTVLSQGKEMWQMAIRLCRYWNIHSFFCIVPAVFSSQTWGLRLFAEALCWGPLVGPWPFWVAAHLMTPWVPVLRIWSPLTIPLLSSASPAETLKPEVNFFFLCVSSTLLFMILFYPFYIQQTLLSLLSIQAFEKQKPERTKLYLGFPMWQVHPRVNEVQRRQPTWTGLKVRETQAEEHKTKQISQKSCSFTCFVHCFLSCFLNCFHWMSQFTNSLCFQRSYLMSVSFLESSVLAYSYLLIPFFDLLPTPQATS